MGSESDSATPPAVESPTPRRSRRNTRLLLLAALALMLAGALYNVLLGRLLGSQEVHLYGQNAWTPGALTSVRIVLLRHDTQRPIRDAMVRVLIRPPRGEIVELPAARTNAAGSVEISFRAPEDEGQGALLVIAESRWGKDFLQRPIRLQPSYRVFLSPDQPAYRAGQKVRLRAWVVEAGTGKPAASRALTLRAFAPGNAVVAERSVRTDDRGSAVSEIELAPGAPTGPYRFKATVGSTSAEANLNVLPGQEPPFPVRLSEVTLYAAPGNLVRGKAGASDRLGSALRGAAARVWLENAAGRTVSWTSGSLDEKGQLAFGLPAPPVTELTRLRLLAEVTDSAYRTAQAMQTVAITPHPIQLAIVPEAGSLVPGVPNRVFLVARYPDGTPAPVPLRYTLNERSGTAQAGPLGVAVITLTPTATPVAARVSATDAQGATGTCETTLPTAGMSSQEWTLRERYRILTGRPNQRPPIPILLRPQRGLCMAGSTVDVDVLASGGDGHVYLDGYTEGRTIFTRVVNLRSGRGSVAIRLPDGLTGILWLRAYQLGPWGDTARSQRAIFVRPGPNPALSLRTQQPVYEPGQTATATLRSAPATAMIVGLRRAAGETAQPAGLPVIFPHTLVPPSLTGYGAVPGGFAEAPSAQRQDAALAALALMPPPEGWTLFEDGYTAKQSVLLQRRAASWARLRWVVLIALALLWLLAIRNQARAKQQAAAQEAAAEEQETPTPESDATAEAAPPAPADNNAARPVHHPLRFILFTAVVALAITILFRVVGQRPSRERMEMIEQTLSALSQEREQRSRAALRAAMSLPPAVVAGATPSEVVFWGATPSAESAIETPFAVPAPAYPGEWKLTATAIGADGSLAETSAPLRVTADFLTEVDVPANVAPGDEVSVTVRLRNTLPGTQRIATKLMVGSGIVIQGDAIQSVSVPGGAGITRTYSIRVTGQSGTVPLSLAATGRRRIQTLRREVRIIPAESAASTTRAGSLVEAASHAVALPDGADTATVTLYPTLASLAAARYQAIQRHACPSAISQAAAIDVARLALGTGDKEQSAISIALERNLQELLACRDESGGFAAFPGEKPDIISTAYTILVLQSVAHLLPGAGPISERARAWAMEQRRADGSWPAASGSDRATTTAFAAWCLGAPAPAALPADKGQAAPGDNAPKDPYLAALSVLAVAGSTTRNEPAPVGVDPRTLRDYLAESAVAMGASRYWEAAEHTVQGLHRDAGTVEATALAVMALARDGRHKQAMREGVAYLLSARQPDGSWGSPLTNALALRALAAANPTTESNAPPAAVEVSVNGRMVGRLDANATTADLRGHLIRGNNTVELRPTGGGHFAYELTIAGENAPRPATSGAPEFSAHYTPRPVRAGQPITFTARVASDTARVVCLEVPLPAGFRPLRGDLEDLVERGQIAAYRVSGREVRLFTELWRRHRSRRIAFRMIAPGPGSILAPAPAAYPLADPAARALGANTRLAVK